MIRSLAVRVVGERFDDVRARVDEVAMEPQDALWSRTTSGTNAPACR